LSFPVAAIEAATSALRKASAAWGQLQSEKDVPRVEALSSGFLQTGRVAVLIYQALAAAR